MKVVGCLTIIIITFVILYVIGNLIQPNESEQVNERLSKEEKRGVELITTKWAARRLYDDTWYRYHSLEDQEQYNETLAYASDHRISEPLTEGEVHQIQVLAIKDRHTHFNRTEVEWPFDAISISQRRLRKMIHTLPDDYLETERSSPACQWYRYYWMFYHVEIHNRGKKPGDRGYTIFDEKGESFDNLQTNFNNFPYKSETAHLAQQDVNANFWAEDLRIYRNFE